MGNIERNCVLRLNALVGDLRLSGWLDARYIHSLVGRNYIYINILPVCVE